MPVLFSVISKDFPVRCLKEGVSVLTAGVNLVTGLLLKLVFTAAELLLCDNNFIF